MVIVVVSKMARYRGPIASPPWLPERDRSAGATALLPTQTAVLQSAVAVEIRREKSRVGPSNAQLGGGAAHSARGAPRPCCLDQHSHVQRGSSAKLVSLAWRQLVWSQVVGSTRWARPAREVGHEVDCARTSQRCVDSPRFYVPRVMSRAPQQHTRHPAVPVPHLVLRHTELYA